MTVQIVEGAWQRPDGRFVRNVFMDLSQFDTWRHKTCGNVGVYRSAFRYSRPLVEQTPEGRSQPAPQDVLLYEGFYMDLDKSPLDGKAWHELKEECGRILDVLDTVFGIKESQVSIAFSGSKGVHLYIPPEVMGIQPAWNLNEAFRNMAERIGALAKLPSLDLKIYDRRRVLRVINSVHNKTRLYKAPLSWEEFRSWSLPRVLVAASAPRERPPLDLTFSPKAGRLLRESFSRVERKILPKGPAPRLPLKGKIPPCVERLIRQGVGQGYRNTAAFALASFLMQQGMGFDDTLSFLELWAAQHTDPPLDSKEVANAVKSVYRHGYTVGCRMLKEIVDCQDAGCSLR